MKKLAIIILILVSVFAKAQTSVYHPFPDSNAVWNEDYYYSDPGPPHCQKHDWWSFVINGDTLINSSLYHKLYIPACNTNNNCHNECFRGYSCAFRQDTTIRKVWYVPPDSTNEFLLYDFSLNVGDSIHVFLTNFFRWGIYSAKVVSIDSVIIGNDYRKRWSFSPRNDIVIEGIGSINGLLEYQGDADYPWGDQYLNCFQQNGQSLYPDTTSSCELITSIKNNSQKIELTKYYPNPFRTSATFVSSNKGELKIYNAFGRLVQEERINNESIIINRNSLVDGIYIYQLINDKGESETGKFIIE